MMPEEKTQCCEEGVYQYFDVREWRRIPGWFKLNYCELAKKPEAVRVDNSS
jgi:hypothetical protein